MIKLTIMAAVALLLSMTLDGHSARAQDSALQGPSTNGYLECARQCEKSFYFSEESDPTFAGLRNACIEGCGFVADDNMSAYQSCNVGCQDIFPYRHGTNPDFAEFQKTCINGCPRAARGKQ